MEQLVERARQLRSALNELDQELWEIIPSYNALKAAFYAAHEALLWEWGDFTNHSAAAKAKRRPLYDARMEAGCAWHPTRKTHDTLQAVRKSMAVELRRINEELEEP